MTRKSMFLLTVMATVPSLAGCASIAPQRPLETPPGLAWSQYLTTQSAVTSAAIDERWWQQFGDPVLSGLIHDAAADNIDMAIARSRLAEARANRRATIAGFGPNLDLAPSVTAQRQSENSILPVGRIPGFEPENIIFAQDFDASWEIDAFGRNPIRVAEANASVAARQAERDETLVSLLSEVARNYIELRQAQTERAVLLRKAALQQERLSMTLRKQQLGQASAPDVDLETSQLGLIEAAIPALDAQIRASMNAIAVLLGKQPGALHPQLQSGGQMPATPAVITSGLTSDLLRRRPDVRIAEYHYASTESGRRLAELALYPTFNLLGSSGLESTNLTDLFDPASIAANIGALLSWSIYDGGRRAAQRTAASERSNQAALAYRGAMLGALADVETHAARYVEAGREVRNLAETLEHRARLVDHAKRRFEAGTNNRFDMVSARIAAADSEQMLLKARARQLLDLVSFQKALGGGWRAFEAAEAGDADH